MRLPRLQFTVRRTMIAVAINCSSAVVSVELATKNSNWKRLMMWLSILSLLLLVTSQSFSHSSLGFVRRLFSTSPGRCWVRCSRPWHISATIWP